MMKIVFGENYQKEIVFTKLNKKKFLDAMVRKLYRKVIQGMESSKK